MHSVPRANKKKAAGSAPSAATALSPQFHLGAMHSQVNASLPKPGTSYTADSLKAVIEQSDRLLVQNVEALTHSIETMMNQNHHALATKVAYQGQVIAVLGGALAYTEAALDKISVNLGNTAQDELANLAATVQSVLEAFQLLHPGSVPLAPTYEESMKIRGRQATEVFKDIGDRKPSEVFSDVAASP
jgi:hypothetical protein